MVLYIEVQDDIPDSKVHVAHIGPTWVLSTPGRPHVGPMNLAIWDSVSSENSYGSVISMIILPQ